MPAAMPGRFDMFGNDEKAQITKDMNTLFEFSKQES
jgi:hypothetical protein